MVSALLACSAHLDGPGDGDESALANGSCPSALLDLLGGDSVTRHNAARAEVLIGGAEIFDGVADLIASAEHDVEMQTWRWDVGSDAAQRVLDGLRRLESRRRDAGATRPVVVRFLLNRVIVQSSDLLRSVAAEIAELALDPALVDVELVEFLASGVGANHAKTVAVDGKAAIVTGANVAFGYGESPDWWDSGVHLSGEVVDAIDADFAQMWMKGRRWLCGAERPPSTSPVTDEPQPTEPDPCWGAPMPPLMLPAQLTAGACLPMLVATHPENGSLFPSADNDNPQARLFLGALGAASSILRIQSPNLNEEAVQQAILAAVRRGVTVQLLLSKDFEEAGESLPGRGGANDTTIAALGTALADSPDALRRLDIRWYSLDGASPIEGTKAPASHVKYLSVDGHLAIAGSANLDKQSWRNSHELNVAVDDVGITTAWDLGLFDVAWNRAVSAAPYVSDSNDPFAGAP